VEAAMTFVQRLIVLIDHWSAGELSPHAAFVDEQSERLVEMVFANTTKAIHNAHAAKLREPPQKSEIIAALIDKLQDAGF
jgi:hypothetical protein